MNKCGFLFFTIAATATIFLPLLSSDTSIITEENDLIKHLKEIADFYISETIDTYNHKNVEGLLFYKLSTTNEISIKFFLKNDLPNHNINKKKFTDPAENNYTLEKINAFITGLDRLIDKSIAPPDKAVFSFRDISQGECFKQVSFYSKEQLVYKNLPFTNISNMLDCIDIRNENSFFKKEYYPKTFPDGIKTVEFFNGWYTEKIGTYNEQGKLSIKSTYQHYLYILLKYGIISILLGTVSHKLYFRYSNK